MEELKRNQVISIQVIEMLEQLPCANEKDASSIDLDYVLSYSKISRPSDHFTPIKPLQLH